MLEVEFPITCPACQRESLSRVPAATVNRILRKGGQLTLRSACHGVEWQASTSETEQIRQYLWVANFA
jgi:hypothetical protein